MGGEHRHSTYASLWNHRNSVRNDRFPVYCVCAGIRVFFVRVGSTKAGELCNLVLTFAWVKQEILSYLQIHPVNFGKIAACRQTIILRIDFDLSKFFDLVLKVSKACFRRLKFLIILNHR